MTQLEFINVVSWTRRELWDFVYQTTIRLGHINACKYLLNFRRNIQVACSKYSKGKEFDGIQHNAVRYSELILKWIKGYYRPWAEKEVIKQKPNLLQNPRKIKNMVNVMWERFVRANSY